MRLGRCARRALPRRPYRRFWDSGPLTIEGAETLAATRSGTSTAQAAAAEGRNKGGASVLKHTYHFLPGETP